MARSPTSCRSAARARSPRPSARPTRSSSAASSASRRAPRRPCRWPAGCSPPTRPSPSTPSSSAGWAGASASTRWSPPGKTATASARSSSCPTTWCARSSSSARATSSTSASASSPRRASRRSCSQRSAHPTSSRPRSARWPGEVPPPPPGARRPRGRGGRGRARRLRRARGQHGRLGRRARGVRGQDRPAERSRRPRALPPAALPGRRDPRRHRHAARGALRRADQERAPARPARRGRPLARRDRRHAHAHARPALRHRALPGPRLARRRLHDRRPRARGVPGAARGRAHAGPRPGARPRRPARQPRRALRAVRGRPAPEHAAVRGRRGRRPVPHHLARAGRRRRPADDDPGRPARHHAPRAAPGARTRQHAAVALRGGSWGVASRGMASVGALARSPLSGPLPSPARLIDAFRRNELTIRASAISFRALYALIPFALFVLALAGTLSLDSLWTSHLAPEIAPRVSPAVFQILDSTISNVLSSRQLFWVTIGFLLMLWGTSSAVRAVMKSFDAIYDTEDRRSTLERFRRSVWLALACGGCLVATVAVLHLGPLVLDGVLGGIVRYLLAAALLWSTVTLLVRFAPAAPQPLAWVSFGSSVVVVGWLITWSAYGFYITVIADLGSAFGAFAAIIVLLAFLQLSTLVLLIGALVDS